MVGVSALGSRFKKESWLYVMLTTISAYKDIVAMALQTGCLIMSGLHYEDLHC